MTLDICERLYRAYAKPSIYFRRGRTALYPAQASIKIDDTIYGTCHRRAYFEWKGYEPCDTVNPDWELSADVGTWYHIGVTELLRRKTIDTGITILSDEHTFFLEEDKYLLSGRIDLFLMDNYTNKLYGVDVKTVGEYMSKRTVTSPKIEHILQCAVYLYAFNKTAAHGKRQVEEWIILYISRDENWDLKKNLHGSPLMLMWQYSMFFEDGYICVRNHQGSITKYKDITMEAIGERYDLLMSHILDDNLPPRDYDAQYSEEQIVALYEADLLEYKKDIKVVEKWKKDGAPEGQLNLVMGDSECRFCSYATQCYSQDPLSHPKSSKILYDIPPLITGPTQTKGMF
jgi:CRISPR/Cas system-associated exonuclease Cas4 (RecB family)